MRIGINCGHTLSGQPGCGAVGFLDESIETRQVGKRLETLLMNMGHTVYDCTNDYAVTTGANLAQIAAMANRQKLDLFVSIHFNSGGGHGTEVFTYGGQKLKEAEKVCKRLNALGFTNRGVKDGSKLYVIRNTNATAMLVEVCFVDSKDDADRYHRLGADCVAQAICAAITGTESEDITLKQYEELKQEIQALKPMIYDYMDGNMPSWAKPTIQKLMDKKIIQGDDKGRLGLTTDMLRMFVANDRAGLYN